MSTQHTDSFNAPVSGDLTPRKLRTTVTTNSEERGFPNSFVEKITGIFRKNPGLSTKVENLQKNPAAVKNLEKAALTEKSSSKLRSWFKRLDENSNKKEKFFVIATILLFGAGAFMVWKR
ncbi:hypothetical protein V7S43_001439 [Phytophthora oleae]|uniref:RxLR effector protein n=1 Tax=Phytophthora oleae TaxID=2107226 RepID=A0ABD3G3L0_9STRA